MKIILKEDEDAEAFIEDLINKAIEKASHRMRRVFEEVSGESTAKSDTEWVTTEEAQKILGVRSKKKMQKLRDESPMNGIVLSKNGRVYLYHRESLKQYVQKNIVR